MATCRQEYGKNMGSTIDCTAPEQLQAVGSRVARCILTCLVCTPLQNGLYVTLVVDGALYVDHTMFGKLPDAYTEHTTYLRLFGGSVRICSLFFVFRLIPPLESTGSWAI